MANDYYYVVSGGPYAILSRADVGTFTFSLQGDIQEGYKREIDFSDMGGHPNHFVLATLKHGFFQDIYITLSVYAGILVPEDKDTNNVTDANKLTSLAQMLYRLLLTPDAISLTPLCYLYIFSAYGTESGPPGPWWVRSGFINDLKITWKPPYDIVTGKPMYMKAEINFATFWSEETVSPVSISNLILPFSSGPHIFNFADMYGATGPTFG